MVINDLGKWYVIVRNVPLPRTITDIPSDSATVSNMFHLVADVYGFFFILLSYSALTTLPEILRF